MKHVSQRGAGGARLTTTATRALRSIVWIVVLALLGAACGNAAVTSGDETASTDVGSDLSLLVADAKRQGAPQDASAIELSSRIGLSGRWAPGATVPTADPSPVLPDIRDGRAAWCEAKLDRFPAATERSTREWLPSDGGDSYRLWIEVATYETAGASAGEAALFAQELVECSGRDLTYRADPASPQLYRHETRQVRGLDAQITTFSSTGVTTLHGLVAVDMVTVEMWLSGIEAVDWPEVERDFADALVAALAAINGVSNL